MAKRGVNSVTIVGAVGSDPKVFNYPNGALTVVSLATTESWTNKQTGVTTEETEWHRVVLKGRHGQFVAEFGRKGRNLYVLGRLKTRKYTRDGVERSVTEIIVDPFVGQCHFLDGDEPHAAEDHHADGETSRNRPPAPNSEGHRTSTVVSSQSPIHHFDPTLVRGIPS